jgi:hypothetical protein
MLDQSLVEIIQAWGNTTYSDILKYVSSIWNKEELPEQWNVSIVPK